MSSKRHKQDKYLKDAKRVGMLELLEGVRLIFEATTQKRKYQALIDELVEAGFLSRSGPRTFDILKEKYEFEIVYIQPERETLPGATVISFDQIGKLVGKKRDRLSQRFAASLETWSTIEAGERKDAA